MKLIVLNKLRADEGLHIIFAETDLSRWMDSVRTTTNRERKTKSGQAATVSQREAKLRRLFGFLSEHCTRQRERETSNFMPSFGSVAQQSEKVSVYELQPQVKATTTAKKRKLQENEFI